MTRNILIGELLLFNPLINFAHPPMIWAFFSFPSFAVAPLPAFGPSEEVLPG